MGRNRKRLLLKKKKKRKNERKEEGNFSKKRKRIPKTLRHWNQNAESSGSCFALSATKAVNGAAPINEYSYLCKGLSKG